MPRHPGSCRTTRSRGWSRISHGCTRRGTSGSSTASTRSDCATSCKLDDQSEALRLVAFIDRAYDAQIPIRASGHALSDAFSAEMLAGGYRKKYLRAVSRLIALTAS
ncbi:AFG1/ZapE family ATPase [Microbacterium elymi]|uniref:AFG1/ZapE family ATPase n=1 Tax=Microbacterium elymi TaxID=2909587 RepID=UPI003390138E